MQVSQHKSHPADNLKILPPLRHNVNTIHYGRAIVKNLGSIVIGGTFDPFDMNAVIFYGIFIRYLYSHSQNS